MNCEREKLSAILLHLRASSTERERIIFSFRTIESELIPLVKRRLVYFTEKKRVREMYIRLERNFLRMVVVLLIFGGLFFLGIFLTARAVGSTFDFEQKTGNTHGFKD